MRIYVVDDDTAVLRSLSALLAGEGFEVSPYESAEAFLEACDERTTGCILLDMSMPGMDGLQVQTELNRRGIQMPVIFLTGHGDVPMSVRAMKAGAHDFLQKPVAADTLIVRLSEALSLEEQRLQKLAAIGTAHERLSRLTSREAGVLELLLQGNTNKQVARLLDLSPRTVEIHRKNILAKTGTANLVELGQLRFLSNSA